MSSFVIPYFLANDINIIYTYEYFCLKLHKNSTLRVSGLNAQGWIFVQMCTPLCDDDRHAPKNQC